MICGNAWCPSRRRACRGGRLSGRLPDQRAARSLGTTGLSAGLDRLSDHAASPGRPAKAASALSSTHRAGSKYGRSPAIVTRSMMRTAGIIRRRIVLARTVVPECDRILLPAKAALMFRSSSEGVEMREKPVAFLAAQANDGIREAGVDVQAARPVSGASARPDGAAPGYFSRNSSGVRPSRLANTRAMSCSASSVHTHACMPGESAS